jgi:hypothetical protein
MRAIFSELQQQARSEGFDRLRITAVRVSGASFDPSNIYSAKRIDITWELGD